MLVFQEMVGKCIQVNMLNVSILLTRKSELQIYCLYKTALNCFKSLNPSLVFHCFVR